MFFTKVRDFFSQIFNPAPPAPEPTIAEIALAQNAEGQFETLVAALQITGGGEGGLGLNNLLEVASDADAGPITVFAPTDEAFRETAKELGVMNVDLLADGQEMALAIVGALGENGDTVVSEVLKYHVKVGGSTVDSLQGQTVVTLADATIVDSNSFNVAGNVLDDADPGVSNPEFIDGLTDIAASNGFIQAIDRVLLPSDLDEPTSPTIAETALSLLDGEGGFATLVAALQVTQDAGLNMFLDAASNPNADITVLAPTNAAFRATAEALGVDTTGLEDGADIALAIAGVLGAETVSDILAYHVILDGKTLGELGGEKVVETALDGTYLGFDGNEIIDADSDSAPMVIGEDVATTNGKIQIIDTVLLPVDLAEDSREYVRGSRKDDFLETGSGKDTVVARKGDDVIITNDGRDKIFAGSGDDIIISGAGNDRVYGGRGEDLIIDGAGNDKYSGGWGADTFDFTNIEGDNTVTTFSSRDVIIFSTEDFGSFEEVLEASDRSWRGVEIEVGDASVFLGTYRGIEEQQFEFV